MNRMSSNIIYLAPLIIGIASFAGCYLSDKTNVRPYGKMPPVAQEGYFVCKQCGSLDGGLSGTGPTKQLCTDQGDKCMHDWQPIGREEFMRIGVERFQMDWSKEAFFWSRFESKLDK